MRVMEEENGNMEAKLGWPQEKIAAYAKHYPPIANILTQGYLADVPASLVCEIPIA